MHGSQESVFIKHIPCEACGSRDNAGLYTDGHTYCFGCGHRTSPSISSKLNPVQVQHIVKGIPPLPYDSTIKLSTVAYEWILNYITPAEIAQLRIMWSNSTQSLVFPFFTDGELHGYITRNFGDTGPKYRIHGVKTKISKVYGTGEPLVFTEDLLSAVVVARSASARPLFGTSLPQDYLQRNSRMYLWLDKDKGIEALKQCNHYKQYGYNISPIFSENDPKTYSKGQIAEFLKIT